MAEEHCPQACQVKLDNHTENICELKAMNITQWEQIDKRVKTGTLLTITSIVVGILGALLSAIYFQVSGVSDEVSRVENQMHMIREDVVRVETKLDINNRHNRQGLSIDKK